MVLMVELFALVLYACWIYMMNVAGSLSAFVVDGRLSGKRGRVGASGLAEILDEGWISLERVRR